MVALRAAVFPLSAKNRRSGHFLPPPPSSARVKQVAMYRRVMTVTVSPATFKSERWLQARLMRTRSLKINARLAHLTRQEVNPRTPGGFGRTPTPGGGG